MWSRKVVWWLALKLIIRDQVLVGDDAIKSLGSGGVCLIREKFLYLVGYTELVVKRLRRFTTSSVRHWHLEAWWAPRGATFFLLLVLYRPTWLKSFRVVESGGDNQRASNGSGSTQANSFLFYFFPAKAGFWCEKGAYKQCQKGQGLRAPHIDFSEFWLFRIWGVSGIWGVGDGG